ncbi:hypothetical protein CDR19_04390 [Ectopseudomonas toyotomiensis]|uniref:Uncharacterized protein n=1 Tax=Ectopseudomonas toyotomiensis TaxID=554344 RepID=A0A1I5R2L3_9GAMM|nr:hypothetical protein [Pseudomonas toyotomiensis]KJU80990.1 hypothetical protein N619_01080 [Pseudomonas oleovorans]PIA74308.1 hypothetical protein CDR19_04390 [Pseudomonas toyotomiensis]SFP52725.1 hypothetical protein SAMN05216177_103258 [Pseudomonas toyotomiensis]
MNKEPRFLPPKGLDMLHLASTDGHSCVIYRIDPADGKPGSIIPDRFRKQAVGEGCDVVGLNLNDEGGGAGPTKEDLILAAITAVMERQAPDELEGDGRAKLAAVSKQVGFKVTKVQYEAAWPKFVESLGAGDKDEDDDGVDD